MGWFVTMNEPSGLCQLVLTPPLKLMMVKQRQFANQELMVWPRQSFGEDVCKLEFTENMWKTNDLEIIFI